MSILLFILHNWKIQFCIAKYKKWESYTGLGLIRLLSLDFHWTLLFFKFERHHALSMLTLYLIWIVKIHYLIMKFDFFNQWDKLFSVIRKWEPVWLGRMLLLNSSATVAGSPSKISYRLDSLHCRKRDNHDFLSDFYLEK